MPVHAGADGDAPAGDLRARRRERARDEGFDAIVYDTAGRLAIDDELMHELEEIVAATEPANTLLVCDALMGRDAVHRREGASPSGSRSTASILTKLDGDARGGAALAVKAVTGVPIKFLGTGETLDRLEEFRPEGLASRILGMGDIVGLVKDFEEVVDEREAEHDAARLLKGQFGLDDLLKQLKMVQKLGPLREVVAKLPMFGALADQVEESQLVRVESLIRSMTPDERKRPELIDKSRARGSRAAAAGAAQDVRELVGALRADARDDVGGSARRGGASLADPGDGRLGRRAAAARSGRAARRERRRGASRAGARVA